LLPVGHRRQARNIRLHLDGLFITTRIKILNPHAALSFRTASKCDGAPATYLVVSDMHLGFEHGFVEKGIQINSKLFTQGILTEIHSILKILKPGGIILLGDIKDSITRVNPVEWYHIPHFLKELSKSYHVFLVPGNHDANIENLCPNDISIASSTGITIDDTLFLHGHTMPSRKKSSVKKIIMGHLHPILYRPESVLNGQRVWIFLRVRKESVFRNEEGYLDLVMVPSINQYIMTTYPYEKKNSIHSRSPIMRSVTRMPDNIERALIIGLEGYVLGDQRLLPFIT
jgi:uncharacterized protein